jgi:hypothetical protein
LNKFTCRLTDFRWQLNWGEKIVAVSAMEEELGYLYSSARDYTCEKEVGRNTFRLGV